MPSNDGVLITNSTELALENERLMNQALLMQHSKRRKSLSEEAAKRKAEEEEEERRRLAEETSGEQQEQSEQEPEEEESAVESAKAAEALRLEHDELVNSHGLSRLFLTLQYNSRLIVVSQWFNYLIIFVIIIAGINVGVQTYAESPLLDTLDLIILICFSVEVVLKILAEGYKPWMYWTGKDWKWNNFDFTIVFMSLPFWGSLFGSGSLALLRLVRLMRLGKLIKKIPALQMIVQGLTGGLSSIGYILILLFLVYYLFAVVGFYFFGENDPFNFGTIPMSMITLFRCSTLDAWSDIMNVNIFGCSNYPGLYVEPTEDDPNVPSMLLCEHPNAQLGLAGIYFVFFIITSAMVMMSLFIGTVTLSMNQSMENLRLLSERKRKREAFLKNKAIVTAKFVEDATKAGAGNITHRSRSVKSEPATHDMSGSHDRSTESPARIVRSHTTGGDSLQNDVLLRDHSEMGDSLDPQAGNHASIHRAMYVQSLLDHQQEEDPDALVHIGGPFAFVTHFRRKTTAIFMTDKTAEEVYARQEKTKRYLLKAMGEDVQGSSSSDDPTHGYSLLAIRYYHFSNICRRIAENPYFVNFVTLIIVLAGIVVGFQTDPRALAVPELVEALGVLNYIILTVFTIECVLKIVGNGFTPMKYFDDGWNKFDFIIVVGSYVPGVGSLLVILRLLRLLRVLKLLRSLPQLAVILSAMMLGIGSIGYIALILFLVFYVFAILGMILFGSNDPFHFGSLHMAMLTLFRISTLDAWHQVLYINMFGCDQYGAYNSVYADYPHRCTNPHPLGFMAVVYFILFVIVGAQVLLTLFIGVVTTSMDQATESKKELQKLEERVGFVQNRFTLSSDQIDNFRKCFALLDLDSGGTIEEEELKIGLQIVNSTMTDEEIVSRMKASDSSVDGVDLVGFIIFMCNLPKFKQKRMFMKVVRLFRAYKKRKMEEAGKAKFYSKSLHKMGQVLSPRSLLSPRSAPAAEQAETADVAQSADANTNNDISTSGAEEGIPPSIDNARSNAVVEMLERGHTDGSLETEQFPISPSRSTQHEVCVELAPVIAPPHKKISSPHRHKSPSASHQHSIESVDNVITAIAEPINDDNKEKEIS